jgi:hypothetical protein
MLMHQAQPVFDPIHRKCNQMGGPHLPPNLTGQSQTRSFTITGDELRIQNPGPTAGAPSELVYRRDK